MKPIRTIVALCSVISVLAACGGGDDAGTVLGISKPQARFINAVPAGPNLDYYLNGKVDQSGVAYKGVTRYHDVDSGTQTASYDVSGTTATVASQAFSAANGHHYTTIALPSTTSLISVIDDPYDKGLLSDKARVRSFNASPNAQNVDVYVVPPGTDITTVSPTMAGCLPERRTGNDAGFGLPERRHVPGGRHDGRQQVADPQDRAGQHRQQRGLAAPDDSVRRRRRRHAERHPRAGRAGQQRRYVRAGAGAAVTQQGPETIAAAGAMCAGRRASTTSNAGISGRYQSSDRSRQITCSARVLSPCSISTSPT